MSSIVNENRLGEYLKELRTSRGLSLKALAKALDVDFSLISKIEHGERSLSLDMIPGLAKALDADFKTLQIDLMAFRVAEEFGAEEYASEGLKKALKRMSSQKREINYSSVVA